MKPSRRPTTICDDQPPLSSRSRTNSRKKEARTGPPFGIPGHSKPLSSPFPHPPRCNSATLIRNTTNSSFECFLFLRSLGLLFFNLLVSCQPNRKPPPVPDPEELVPIPPFPALILVSKCFFVTNPLVVLVTALLSPRRLSSLTHTQAFKLLPLSV